MSSDLGWPRYHQHLDNGNWAPIERWVNDGLGVRQARVAAKAVQVPVIPAEPASHG